MASNRPDDKALRFGVNSLYTDVAGVLGAIVVGFAALDSFTVQLSTNLLVASWSVGSAGFLGPLRVHLRAVRAEFGLANLQKIIRCGPAAVDPDHSRDAERRCRRDSAFWIARAL